MTMQIQHKERMRDMKKTVQWVLLLAILLLALLPCALADEENVLVLPKDLKVIDEEAFYGDTSISKVIVPEGVTTIGKKAFAESSLIVIELPDTLTTVAEDAFYYTVPISCIGILSSSIMKRLSRKPMWK